MILLIDLALLIFLLSVWFNIERKWETVYVSRDPTNTFWNHVYIDPEEDASTKLQAAIDFLSSRRGGITQMGKGTYNLKRGLELKGGVCVSGER